MNATERKALLSKLRAARKATREAMVMAKANHQGSTSLAKAADRIGIAADWLGFTLDSSAKEGIR